MFKDKAGVKEISGGHRLEGGPARIIGGAVRLKRGALSPADRLTLDRAHLTGLLQIGADPGEWIRSLPGREPTRRRLMSEAWRAGRARMGCKRCA